ncbi:MAG: UDP-N-acetylmuramoyl-L-alanyl-D-glutamate--2,6-diaminopimelate ligase, partial [Sphingomonadales bacterium]|nr:UDP-N-acetylmuramoyl-L-alanyl-D-glutamate--2,6-diaminopimelate ligase [Sphingomonadales bacterium]
MSTLIENLGVKSPPLADASQGQASNAVITGLALDSRLVDEGYLFAALSGELHDGVDFIPAALKAGANSILISTGSDVNKAVLAETIVIEHDNPRQVLAEMAGRFYSPHPKHCAAITGTNGKTSVASFVKQLWSALGFDGASIGTLGVASNTVNKAGGLTTPDSISFHKNLQELANAGVDHVVFEASSHGLSQHRLDGVEISVAGFTNLSREHLDYHGDMEGYFEAKSRLFVELLAANGTAVINVDDKW